MNRYAEQKPPQWWPPKLSPFWFRIWRPLRQRQRIREHRLVEVEVRGLERLREALDAGNGVLITPNHSAHSDPQTVLEVADQLGMPFYFMSAWQVFHQQHWLGRRILQHHGCFSIDREGTDLKAFRQATEILEKSTHPLVIFPEGEVYHTNDRVTPFREGAAAILLSAARRAKRDLVALPCGIKYEYVEDPTDDLVELMTRLETEIYWRPRPDLPLHERIYRFAEATMALKELEYRGATSAGPLPNRIEALAAHILQSLEDRYEVSHTDRTTPERVKELRRLALKPIDELPEGDPARRQHEHDLDDLFLVLQLFSYPGDYVRERPSIERMAETLDKLEEDMLNVFYPTIKGHRRSIVSFGEPIAVEKDRRQQDVQALTQTMEKAVQAAMDSMRGPGP
ncbi:MAG: lysophospholipid acyltransferase family protein [Planctomycetota bacterium]|nr:lysophospholipid acyltransferase family protein [Planctomycetota bacterium]